MIFTGLLSVAFIGRQLSAFKWFGLIINVLGLVVIGICDFIYKTDDKITDINSLITGKGGSKIQSKANFSIRSLWCR